MHLLLLHAQVVCATCSGAGDSSLSGRSFRLVLVDESSQATEPAVLVPLVRGAQWLVLAGDPRQLPPTITSEKAFEYALDVTLFDRCGRLRLLLVL
jgi:regulator of nonsense transcripts 1